MTPPGRKMGKRGKQNRYIEVINHFLKVLVLTRPGIYSMSPDGKVEVSTATPPHRFPKWGTGSALQTKK